MSNGKRTFDEFDFNEKLTVVDDYLSSIKPTEGIEALSDRMEWLRRHIPASDCRSDENYVFISYSHRDFKPVYSDLAFFSYNNKKRVRFWYDEGLPAGRDWFSAAQERLKDPHCIGVIFYLSENFLRSNAVMQEIELVQALHKPYLTVALGKNKYCAEDYLDPVRDAALLAKVVPVFPRNDTAISHNDEDDDKQTMSYNDKNEDVFYRIHKIQQAFGVVEEVLSDFVVEEVADGLSLVGYTGEALSLYIPERINGKSVVEVRASFHSPISLYIPKSVKRLLPAEDMAEADDLEWPYMFLLGEQRSPGAIFGPAPRLRRIDVDPENPYFYDDDGILYGRDRTLLRVPADYPWDDRILEGVSAVGPGAFYGYNGGDDVIDFPASVRTVGDNAFAGATLWAMGLNEGLEALGRFAFFRCTIRQSQGLTLPATLREMGEFAFSQANIQQLCFQGKKLQCISRCAFYRLGASRDAQGLPVAVTLPKSVVQIREGAFLDCRGLENLTLPDSVVEIGDYAISGCSRLFSVTLPASVKALSPVAFENDPMLRYIFYGGSSRKYYYFCRNNQVEKTSYRDLMITRDQWARRGAAKLTAFARSIAKRLLSRLDQPRRKKNGKASGTTGRISSGPILSFLGVIALSFWVSYRSRVQQIPTDWLSWLLSAVGVLLLCTGCHQFFWAYTVGRHKRKDGKNKVKEQKHKREYDEISYWDMILDMVKICAVAVLASALISELLLSGIYNLGSFGNLWASLSGELQSANIDLSKLVLLLAIVLALWAVYIYERKKAWRDKHKKTEIKLQYTPFSPPIEYSDSTTGETWTGVAVIDNDSTVLRLNQELCQRGIVLFELTAAPEDSPAYDAQLAQQKSEALALLAQLNAHLEQINDGSFVVKDYASEMIQKL